MNKDLTSKQMVKEQMIKYGFHAPDMTVTEFVEDLLPPIILQEPILDRIREEITKVIDENKVINSNNSRAQNIGLMWVLELIDKCITENEKE